MNLSSFHLFTWVTSLRSTFKSTHLHVQMDCALNRLLSKIFFWFCLCIFGFVFGYGCMDSNVGDACNSNQDCARGLFCDHGAPQGYCTAECSAALPCPPGSMCIPIHATHNKQKFEFVRCLRTCFIQLDCRNGYTCKNIPSSPQKVCFSSE